MGGVLVDDDDAVLGLGDDVGRVELGPGGAQGIVGLRLGGRVRRGLGAAGAGRLGEVREGRMVAGAGLGQTPRQDRARRAIGVGLARWRLGGA